MKRKFVYQQLRQARGSPEKRSNINFDICTPTVELDSSVSTVSGLCGQYNVNNNDSFGGGWRTLSKLSHIVTMEEAAISEGDSVFTEHSDDVKETTEEESDGSVCTDHSKDHKSDREEESDSVSTEHSADVKSTTEDSDDVCTDHSDDVKSTTEEVSLTTHRTYMNNISSNDDEQILSEDMIMNPILFWDEFSSDSSTKSTSHDESQTENTTEVVQTTDNHEIEKGIFTVEKAVTIMKCECCDLKCLVNFSLKEIEVCYNVKADKNWVLQTLKIFRKPCQEYTGTAFVVGGKNVCLSGWLMLYGVSKRVFSEAAELQDKGFERVVHGNTVVVRSSPKAETTRAWLDRFIKLFGEFMPHISITLLPSSLTKYMIYKKMWAHYHGLDAADGIVKKRQFYNIWKEFFPKVKIRKEGMFTKCTVCTVTAEERGKTLNKDKREAVEAVMDKHLEIVKREREAYERHKEKSRQNSKYLCICIDGMDQSKTAIPHLTRKDKTTQHLWRIHTHITGALTHGTMKFGKDALGFISSQEIHADSNLTLNVLMLTLEDHARRYGKLPDVLYLQFDNCWRENKNKYVLAFSFLLVAIGLVKKVKINFLIIGHTHNDVDQIFSRLADALRRLVALTMPDLRDVLEQAYERPCLKTVVLDHVFDFKQWLEPHLAGLFSKHTGPHNFKFQRNDAGETIMQYRQYTRKKGWEPEEGLKCLKTLPSLTDIPPWAKPNLEKLDIPLLKSDIPKFFHRMDADKKNWWKTYLTNLSESKQVPPKPSHWPLMTLLSTVGNLNTVEDNQEEEPLPINLRHIWEKVNKTMQPVRIGSQGKRTTKARIPEPQEENLDDMAAENLTTSNITNEEHESSMVACEEDIEQYSSIERGMMVGLYVEDYWPKVCPQIACVEEVDLQAEIVKVHWYSSSWTGPCRESFDGVGINRKKRTELLDIRCCILWQFSLTANRKTLPQATANKLKSAYRELQLKW